MEVLTSNTQTLITSKYVCVYYTTHPGSLQTIISPCSGFILQGYLYKYGYLPKSDVEIGKIRSAKHVQRAVMMLQKYMGLPMTGEIDTGTMDMMAKPRYGT